MPSTFNASLKHQTLTHMKPQILQLNPILIPAINDELASLYHVHKYFEIADQAAWLREHGPSIQAVITGGHTGISRAMLEQLPALKVVAINGVGTDAVDLEYCRGRNLPVTATLSALTEDVADLAIGLLIAAAAISARGIVSCAMASGSCIHSRARFRLPDASAA